MLCVTDCELLLPSPPVLCPSGTLMNSAQCAGTGSLLTSITLPVCHTESCAALHRSLSRISTRMADVWRD